MTIAYSLCTMASSKWNLSPLWLRWMKMKLRSSSSPTCNVTETLGGLLMFTACKSRRHNSNDLSLHNCIRRHNVFTFNRTKTRSYTCKSTVSQQAAINMPLGCLHCCTRVTPHKQTARTKARSHSTFASNLGMPQQGVINTPTSSQGCITSRITRKQKGNHATAAQQLVNAVASTAP